MAIQLDGGTQYIEVPDDPSIKDFTDCSIIVWIMSDTGAPGGGYHPYFFTKDGSGVNVGDASFLIDRTTGKGYFFDQFNGVPLYTLASVCDGVLRCLALTLSSVDGYKLYNQGVEEDSDSTTGNTIWNNTTPLQMGTVVGSSNYTFDGIIYEARVYNRALTKAEIETIYYARGADNIVNGLAARWLLNEKPDGWTTAMGLAEKSHVDDVESSQGVATDGTYLYTSSSTVIYKREMNGDLIDSLANANNAGTNMNQVNHIHIYDGKLYIGSSNYEDVPKKGYIKVFDADDLSYIEEHQVLDHYCEGCAFYDNAWWVVYTDYRYVSKYDTNWDHVADYELTYEVTGDANLIGYQGITWTDDDIFCSIHHVASPSPCIDRYHWTGSGFDEVERYPAPDDASQGICYLASNERYYIAQRNHPIVDQHSVTITFPVESNLIIDISGNGNHGTPHNSPVYREGPMRLVRPV